MANPLLTAEEWAQVRAYDEQTRRELKALEAAQHPPTPPDTLKEWQDDIEESRLDCLRGLQEDIAVLISVRERWPEIPEIRDRVSYLITIHRSEIEELRKEIQNARS
jgi:hypothetical protein